jgi:signal transduction histidine kinase
VRHAHARTISVNLIYDASSVRLSVKDDGRGFDPQPHSNGTDGHFGIVGMRERAEEMGGTTHISGSAGVGSEVLVSVPIEG